ncbi:MAG: hypothetical protein IT337_00505 [Thermomicrobiales bacterium]|nr:hypothetical protein [Thermomicrobiales bacterium]
MKMRPEGKSMREIRQWVEDTYGDVGPSTKTPLPPEGL